MKHLKLMMVTLILLLALLALKAETLQQSFSATFGPTSTPYPLVEQETDGWRYYSFYRYMSSNYPEKVFHGEAAGNFYASSSNADDCYLISPAKTGGVGWISFWYKISSPPSSTSAIPMLVISTSSDGVTFEEVETVLVPPLDDKNFSHYSKVVNNLNAKYVKIVAKRPSGSYVSYEANFDEIIITDAVASGTPAHISSITGNTTMEGELNQTTPINLTVKGSGFSSGNMTFAVEGANSPFNLLSTSETASSITEIGYALPINFSPVTKGFSRDFLKVSVSGLPELIFPLKGVAVERTIVEGFNEKGGLYDNSGTQTFDYYSGWQVVYGGTLFAGEGTNGANAVYILEGERSMIFRTTLTSPRKMNGVGTIFFMYRPYNPGQQIVFFTETSEDGTVWDLVDNTTAAGGVYIPYIKQVNRPNAKYVRIRIDQPTYQQNGILVDEFVITENNNALPLVSGTAQTVSTESAVLGFSIPLTFSNITSDVSLTIDDPQFVLNKTSLTQNEANGAILLNAAYMPEKNKSFTLATLTISGGGLYFPVKVPVYAYFIQSTLFTNFDAMWGASSTGNYTTDAGWIVANGARDSYYTLFSSPGDVNLNTGGSLTSPPKSQGVGSIHFFARSGWNSTYTVSISNNGTTWTAVASNVALNNNSSYDEIEYVVNSATAKYVRLEVASTGSNMYVDNFTVTRSGKKIPHVTLINKPSFLATKGEEASGNIILSGKNIDSDVQIRFARGNAFSLHDKTSIDADDINDNAIVLPAYFKSETGTYFTDTLIVSGDDFTFERTFPVKGYNKLDMIFQDFDGDWVQGSSYSENNVSGWEVSNGSSATYNVIDGRAHLQLSAGGGLLSIPKSGGVGAVSFLYKTDSYAIPVKISVLKTPTGTPLAVIDTVISGNQPVTPFEYIFNQPEAVYVKIQNMYSGYGNFYIDNVGITVSGKGTPAIIADANLTVSAYAEETAVEQLNISAANISDEVTLTLKHGDSFSIDKTKFTATGELTEETIQVTYQATGQSYVADTLLIESAGLFKSQSIILRGNIRKEHLVEDFNQTGWSPNGTDGNYVVDGWVVTNGTRVLYSQYNTNTYEGDGALRMSSSVSSNLHGSLTSPAKAGGVNNVEFYYHADVLKFYLQTSADGKTWTDNDSVLVSPNFNDYRPYSKEIKDPAALYFRIQTAPNEGGGNYTNWLFIDSIVVDGMPYLRQVGQIEDIATSQSNYQIPVQVAGFLSSNASISMNDGTIFSLQKTALSPAEVADGKKVSFTAVFERADASGIYEDTIVISGDDVQTLYIPLTVNYTKPYVLSDVTSVDEATTSASIDISFALTGLLNTSAIIVLDKNEHFTLSKTEITNEDLKNGTGFKVTFSASEKGEYTDEITISNEDIDPLVIPLKVKYEPTGINMISNNGVLVYCTKDVLHVCGAANGSLVGVFNAQGQSVAEFKINSDKEQFNLPLPAGVYVVKVGENVWKIRK